jgi:hypothetical protein
MEASSVKVGCLKTSIIEISPVKLSVLKIYVLKISPLQMSFYKIWRYFGIMFSPAVPSSNPLLKDFKM